MLRDGSGDDAATSQNAEIADDVGLTYVNDGEPGIARKCVGRGFSYASSSGAIVKDAKTKARIRSLAIPPAWSDVWICPRANGHIQATGRDQRGRKQYRYHPDWQTARDEAKYSKILAFAKALPKLRKSLKRDMRRRSLDRRKVLATVVTLLESTLIRVGNREYARDNGSFGLTTLQDRHVTFAKSEARFRFRGKTGKIWSLAIDDKRIARIVKGCQDLPGQHLFQYETADEGIRAVTSGDVNSYLRELTGQDISAKDFRTWAGTVLAAAALSEFEAVDSEAAAKRNIRRAIETVATRLGNTPTICRKCYVHPEIVNSYLEGQLAQILKSRVERELTRHLGELSAAEAATLAFLHRRLNSESGQRRRSRRPAALSKFGGAAEPPHRKVARNQRRFRISA
jgi:DNA topoisomerase-1